jgi:hypothetical protein
MAPNDEDFAQQQVWLQSGGPARLTWTFNIDGGEVAWLWRDGGEPPLRRLEPLRTPTASALNRHIAVTAYSVTNGGVLHLESGLEHDLLRRVDRDPRVAHIVAQPFRLSWRAEAPNRHTPDLLSVNVDGSVVAWDARSPDQQDADFTLKRSITSSACTAVGWRYEVFGGLEPVERLNLMWLHGFRRRPSWAASHESRIRDIVGAEGATFCELLSADEGSGELKSTMWHLVWTGALEVDTCARWSEHTLVSLPAPEEQ